MEHEEKKFEGPMTVTNTNIASTDTDDNDKDEKEKSGSEITVGDNLEARTKRLTEMEDRFDKDHGIDYNSKK